MGMECCYSNSHERRLPKGILKYAMVTELALLRRLSVQAIVGA